MRTVDFDEVESRSHRPARGGHESVHEFRDLVRRQRVRHGPAIGHGDGARGHDLPCLFRRMFSERLCPVERHRRTALASRVPQLYPDRNVVLMIETADA